MHPEKRRLCLFSSSKPRLKEKKALDKDGRERSAGFILSTGEVIASMISLDFAVIFRIFINLVSILGNMHNKF